MRDISAKINTLRSARAQATLSASPASIEAIRQGTTPKGDPLPIAKIAAIQAAKNTSQIIPYCHPLPVDFVAVDFNLGETEINIEVEVKAVYKTGVEMEALTAAAVAALTIYDMLKMLDQRMEIMAVRLIEKRGGKSDFQDKPTQLLKAAVLVLSDSIAAGYKSDESGLLIKRRLENLGLLIADYRIMADEQQQIEAVLKEYADEHMLDLVITTGGTGLSLRDRTPEAMANIIERSAPGIIEAARAYGQQRIPFSMLSRGTAGLRGNTLIINLPGSRKAVSESLDAILPGLLHAFSMMHNGRHS